MSGHIIEKLDRVHGAVFPFRLMLAALHGVALLAGIDRVPRIFLVTPDMHRVHHSVLRHEHNSTYGFNLSILGWLFRTYTAQLGRGHLGMTIGLAPYQNDSHARLLWSLLLPFRGRD